jgi:hypothetical protein
MTDKPSPAYMAGLRRDLTSFDLSPQWRALIELMWKLQFGRIENMIVRAGQPILDGAVTVVCVARLARTGGTKASSTDEFELKGQVRNLFDELARLENGRVIRLEFRHGLPFLLETAVHAG